MDTTAGVTRSAMEEKATLRSDTEGGMIGATVDAAGRVGEDCAYPNFVRSRPEAKTRPLTNAATTAPPKVIRAIGLDFISSSLLKVFYSGTGTDAPELLTPELVDR